MQQVDTKTQTRLPLPAVTFCDSDLNTVLVFQNRSKCFPGNLCDSYRQHAILTKRGHLFFVTFFSRLKPEFYNESTEELLKNYSVQVNTRLKLQFNTESRADFVAVHSPLMPPQISSLNQAFCRISEKITVVNEVLKPPPYDTECANYKGSKFHSLWDCTFKQKNHITLDSEVYFTKLEQLLKNLNKTSKYLTKHFNPKNKCFPQCRMEHFSTELSHNLAWSDCDKMWHNTRQQVHRFERQARELFIKYKTKMSFVYLLVQMGALLSFWFGISAKSAMFWFRKINFFRNKLRFFTNMLLVSVCFCQVLRVFQSYLKYDTVTKIALQKSYDAIGIFPTSAIAAVFRAENEIAENLTFSNLFNCSIIKSVRTTSGKVEEFKAIVDTSGANLFLPHFKRTTTKSVTYRIDLDLMQSVFGSKNSMALALFPTFFMDPKFLPFSDLDKHLVHVKQVTFVRLPPPYATNCRYYGNEITKELKSEPLGGKNFEYPNSVLYDAQHGCHKRLEQAWLQTNLKCKFLGEQFFSVSDKAKSFFNLAKNFTLCRREQFNLYHNELVRNFSHICRPGCTDHQYTIKMSFLKKMPKSINRFAEIEVLFDKTDFAVVYNSYARLSWFDLFYETFGLFSLWFGISIFGLSQDALLLFCKAEYFL